MQAHSEGSVGIIDVFLTLFLLGVALFIAVAPSRRAQAGGLLCLGAGLSIVWLRLGSVDVALAEAALGGGVLSGILVRLVMASTGNEAGQPEKRPAAAPQWLKAATGVVTGAVMVVVLGAVVLRAEQSGPAWAQAVPEATPEVGVSHGITAVLLGFRSYDTLLESAVLMFAGLVVMALNSDRPPGAREAPVSPTFGWFVTIVAPVLLLLGLWLLFVGGSDSGGAFQSGAVLAGLLILLRLAGVRLGTLDRLLVPLLVVGVVVFVVMSAVGPVAGEPWLTWVGGSPFLIVLAVEVSLTAGITAGLYLLYRALENPGRRISPDEEVEQ